MNDQIARNPGLIPKTNDYLKQICEETECFSLRSVTNTIVRYDVEITGVIHIDKLLPKKYNL